MYERTVYLHVGLPKTGTTTIQNRLFPDHNEFLYLGKHNPKFTPDAAERDRWLRELKINLVQKDRPFFSRGPAKLVAGLRHRFGDALTKHSKYLVSEEGVFSRCLSPAYYNDGRLRYFGSAYAVIDNVRELVCHLEGVLPRIIVTLRRQDQLLHSYFAQDYERYKSIMGFSKISHLVEWLSTEGQGSAPDGLLRFEQLVNYLDRTFGEANVLILTYEQLEEDPNGFMHHISDFMKIDDWADAASLLQQRDNTRTVTKTSKKANIRARRIPTKILELKRRLLGNRSTFVGWILKRKGRVIEVPMETDTAERILARYAECNRRLATRVPQLKAYGYY